MADDEIRRIEEEIRKAEEKKKLLLARRSKKLREIRARQLREKEAWLKKLTAELDKALQQVHGDLYWEQLLQEDVTGLIRGDTVPAQKDQADKRRETINREGADEDGRKSRDEFDR